MTGHAQVGLHIDAPATSLGQACGPDHARRLQAAGPDDRAGDDLAVVRQHHLLGVDLLDAGTEAELDPVALERLGGERLRGVGEPVQHVRRMVDDDHVGEQRRQLGVEVRQHVVDHLGERPRGLDPSCTRPHDHEVERPLLEVLLVPIDRVDDPQDPRAKALSIVHAVERVGVLLGSGRAEEVGLCACGDHQDVATDGDPIGQRHGLGVGIDLGDLAGGDAHRAVGPEHVPQRPGDVGHAELRGGHLVEQRLELVVVVPVDQVHVDAVLGEALRAGHTCEATTHHHDRSLHRHPSRFGRTIAATPSGQRRCREAITPPCPLRAAGPFDRARRAGRSPGR